jgi:dTDP-4-dehydrorhamnose reductase
VKVLVLGARGMIGNAMFRVLSANSALQVVGMLRSATDAAYFSPELRQHLFVGIDVTAPNAVAQIMAAVRPDVVINCIGVTKHVAAGNVPYSAISINALLPHQVALLCMLSGARLIHISTDCVFSGVKGMYRESDIPDAVDVYGRSKQLGEVLHEGAVTLRTSTIGHELRTRYGLLEWFLSQSTCKGYTQAIFSGVPSVIFAEIIRDIVIPNRALSGLYHVAGPSIAKADLLRLVANTYEKDVRVSLDDSLMIDRSLDSSKFAAATGYSSPSWPVMVQSMREDYIKGYRHNV